jgi:hypothetical protein
MNICYYPLEYFYMNYFFYKDSHHLNEDDSTGFQAHIQEGLSNNWLLFLSRFQHN